MRTRPAWVAKVSEVQPSLALTASPPSAPSTHDPCPTVSVADAPSHSSTALDGSPTDTGPTTKPSFSPPPSPYFLYVPRPFFAPLSTPTASTRPCSTASGTPCLVVPATPPATTPPPPPLPPPPLSATPLTPPLSPPSTTPLAPFSPPFPTPPLAPTQHRCHSPTVPTPLPASPPPHSSSLPPNLSTSPRWTGTLPFDHHRLASSPSLSSSPYSFSSNPVPSLTLLSCCASVRVLGASLGLCWSAAAVLLVSGCAELECGPVAGDPFEEGGLGVAQCIGLYKDSSAVTRQLGQRVPAKFSSVTPCAPFAAISSGIWTLLLCPGEFFAESLRIRHSASLKTSHSSSIAERSFFP